MSPSRSNKDHDLKALQAPQQNALTRVDQIEPPLKPQKDRPASPQPRRGCLGTCALFGGLSMLLVTLVFVVLIVVMVVGVVDFLGSPLDSFLGVFGFEKNSTPQEIDSQIIILGIREMSLLQTASGDIEITKEVIDTGAAPDARLRMSYIGSANAGLNLDLLTAEDVVVNPDGGLTITLPPIQILECALRRPTVISSSCTDIPLVQDCDGIRTQLQQAAYERALDALREQAQNNEIQTPDGRPLLDVAYENAESSIYHLIQTLLPQGADTQVTFVRRSDELPPGATCFP